MDEELEAGRAKTGKPDLLVMSIEELSDYIVEMEAEIERVRAAIEAKTSQRGTADSIFTS